MKIELFPNFSGVQKYIINGDRFDEVEFDSNYSALLEFIKLHYKNKPSTQLEVCQRVKDIILNENLLNAYLEYCDFNLREAIIFLSQINSKKIFTSKVVQCLKDRNGKTRRKKNSSRVRVECATKNKGRPRKKTKSRRVRKA